MRYNVLVLALLATLAACKDSGNAGMQTGTDYPVYGGNKAGNRYSPLDQINSGNVQTLKVAWTYDAREKPVPGATGPQRVHEIQCQPIVIDGVLYGTTAGLAAFAANAATGEQLWIFEPSRQQQRFNTNRGVMFWQQGNDKRILYSAGSDLYALDARTGQIIPSFGRNGKVDLHEGLGVNMDHDVSHLSVTATTPGVIYHNTLVLGSSVSEGGDAAPGHVRGYDVVSGALKWTFHTIPQPGEPGYDTWPKDAYKKVGAANNWSGLVVDEKRGWVFFGTGSPSSDFYGGDRAGENLFANCILALEAETGKMKWYFQTIHHDLWDRDIPCPPNLVTLPYKGRPMDVVVQATKDGMVYVLNRDSGYSLFPLEELPVPTKALPGEQPWPTQKFPVKPFPFSRQRLTENDLTDISPEAHAFATARFRQLGGPTDKYIAPDTMGTLAFGYSGGAEWGGNAIDPDGTLYLNANEDAWELQMVDAAQRDRELAALSVGNALYAKTCAACHGMDRKGSGHEFPNLLNIGQRRTETDIDKMIRTGSGRMPAFTWLEDGDRKAIVNFLLNKETKVTGEHAETEHAASTASRKDAGAGKAAAGKADFPFQPRYIAKVWKKFTDADGYNAVKPPWGTLSAIDLATGEYRWRVPLGEFPELTKKGIPVTGTENYGGPLVTAGGLVFIAATRDERIRAFERRSGKIAWEYQLPAGGFATPITYSVNGRQYIVIAAGGGRGKKGGGFYIAFALP